MIARFTLLTGLTAGLCLGAAAAFTPQDDREKPASEEKPKKAEVGEKAPDFQLKDLQGKTHKLSDHEGKIIVLEWFNPECPYVVHIHKEDHPFKKWSTELHEDEDYVYFAINSGAPGEQGTGLEKNRKYQKDWKIKYPILDDSEGKVGRMYAATRTPHMYVIDTEGVLRYAGAIDNAPLGRIVGEGEQVNYVKRAIEQIESGETVSPDTTREYGCTIKFASADRPQRGRGAGGEPGRSGDAPRGGRGGRGGAGGGAGGGHGGAGGGE